MLGGGLPELPRGKQACPPAPVRASPCSPRHLVLSPASPGACVPSGRCPHYWPLPGAQGCGKSLSGEMELLPDEPGLGSLRSRTFWEVVFSVEMTPPGHNHRRAVIQWAWGWLLSLFWCDYMCTVSLRNTAAPLLRSGLLTSIKHPPCQATCCTRVRGGQEDRTPERGLPGRRNPEASWTDHLTSVCTPIFTLHSNLPQRQNYLQFRAKETEAQRR